MQVIPQGQYFLRDHTLQPVTRFAAHAPTVSTCIYEVIRVLGTQALFINDHLERLNNSFRIAGFRYTQNKESLLLDLKHLIATNPIDEGNIKLEFHFIDNGETRLMAYYVQTNYPTEAQQKSGVKCSLQFTERQDPNAKIYNPEVREKANTLIEQLEVYETLLVNHNSCLTEGSRSNLFFIKDNTLITAEDSMVLPGVIRKQVLHSAKEEGIPIVFQSVSIEEIAQMDAAFITGTSPRMLAIAQLGDVSFKVNHPLFITLSDLLQQKIEQQL